MPPKTKYGVPKYDTPTGRWFTERDRSSRQFIVVSRTGEKERCRQAESFFREALIIPDTADRRLGPQPSCLVSQYGDCLPQGTHYFPAGLRGTKAHQPARDTECPASSPQPDGKGDSFSRKTPSIRGIREFHEKGRCRQAKPLS